MTEKSEKLQILSFTAEIVAAYVAHHRVELADMQVLIRQIYQTLAGLATGDAGLAGAQGPGRPLPAVAARKSITPDHIVCLEDGKKLKMLKRHLMSHYGLTPEQYRERWDLPADYPMVAPNYALHRQALAKKIGLGRSRKAAD